MKSIGIFVIASLFMAGCVNQNQFGNAQPGVGVSSPAPAQPTTPTPAPSAPVSAKNMTVNFAADSSAISGNGTLAQLNALALALKSSGQKIRVEGYADELGTREYNLAMGAQRAAAVRNYLVERGVSQSQISVVSYGNERALSTCSEESCRAKNRRAVVIVL